MFDRMRPKNDFVFQMIFGRQENADILLSFLNAIFKLPSDKTITAINIVNPKLDKEHLSEKSCVLDVSARTATGVQINIEI